MLIKYDMGIIAVNFPTQYQININFAVLQKADHS